MGRRSINTTKSGKYMNPTDQARKEARKKELKKNKRQRQMVRAAVLKGKDPGQILEEMEKIDEMEYNVLQPSPLNEKVLREKRKKLKETFDRVMRLYHNDDPELWADLKRKEVDYEKKRLKKQQYYESVKSAQSVQIDEIPLPQTILIGGAPIPGSLNRVPPPSALQIPPFIPDMQQSNSNKYGEPTSKQTEKLSEKKKKDPPGCPPGPPPDLTKFRELDSDAEDDIIQESLKKSKSKKNLEEDDKLTSKDDDDSNKSTSLQQRMVQISGQNIDAFMKEIENVQRNAANNQDSKENSDKDSQKSSGDENDNDDADEDDDDDIDDDDDDDESENSDNSEDDEEQQKIIRRKISDKEQSNLSIPLPPIPPPPPAMGMPGGPPPPPIGMPPAMMFRPPPMRPGNSGGGAIPGITIRMPPGPPPGRPGMQMPHRMGGIRMPPGPPPGMPPNRGGMHHHNQKGHHHNHPAKDSKGITTITAKPQIRNLSADVTRFLPSALRVKREDQKLPAAKRPKLYPQEVRQTESKKGATKDDAYMQFMREMQGLL